MVMYEFSVYSRTLCSNSTTHRLAPHMTPLSTTILHLHKKILCISHYVEPGLPRGGSRVGAAGWGQIAPGPQDIRASHAYGSPTLGGIIQKTSSELPGLIIRPRIFQLTSTIRGL